MQGEISEGPSQLPRRETSNAMYAARLWRESECYDRSTIERCLEALRALDMPTAVEQPTMQHEIDGVIARWRAERERGARRAADLATPQRISGNLCRDSERIERLPRECGAFPSAPPKELRA